MEQSEMTASAWQLQIIDPQGHTHLVVVGAPSVTIGRDPDCEVHLNERKVSGRHARIDFGGDRPQITDLESTNGTRLAGVDLQANVTTLWGEGQALQIQGFTVTVARLASQTPPAAIPSSVAGLLQQAQRNAAATRRHFGRLRGHRYAPIVGMSFLCFCLGLWAGYGLGTVQASEGQGKARVTPSRSTVIPTWTPTPTSVASPVGSTPLPTATLVPVITPSNNTSGAGRSVSTRVPTRTPAPAAPSQSSSTGASAIAPGPLSIAANLSAPGREWDSRLNQLGVTVDEAQVTPGQAYWRLAKAIWQNEHESGGKHHIYVEALDESGRRVQAVAVRIGWDGDSQILTPEAKPADEYPMNFDMHAAGHAYRVAVEGQASDVVSNLGMGSIEARHYAVHTSYLLTFQRTLK
jgi:hypothetical protein